MREACAGDDVGNVWYTGCGQKLVNVHSRDDCLTDYCVIHNPSDHPMRDFPTHYRDDRGYMERICPHGIGHPDPDDFYADPVHGCDGCCAPRDTSLFRSPVKDAVCTTCGRTKDDPMARICSNSFHFLIPLPDPMSLFRDPASAEVEVVQAHTFRSRGQSK